MSLIVYTYKGFGDYCVAFGIIKEYAKIYDKLFCYTDEVTVNTINTRKRLFSSIKNVEIMEEPYDDEKTHRDLGIAHMKYWFDTVLPWYKNPNLPPPDWFDESWLFDKAWYRQSCVSFYLKWSNFYFERNLNKEKEIFYDKLALKDNEEFIFLQEDPNRNMFIKREYIDPNIKLIEFSKLLDINVLDILYTVEKSKEVHTYNTGLTTFIDLMNIKHDNLNFHKYIRPMIFEEPVLRLNWNFIK
jgi:hypothetical protein